MTSSEAIQNALRGSRLVSVALLLGQAIFAVIIAVVLNNGSFEPVADDSLASVLTTFGVVAGVASLPLAFVLRRLIWKRAAGVDDARLVQAYFGGNVAFQAVLEGAGLLNLTFWLITGAAIPFVPVFAVLFVVGVLALFRAPTP